MAYSEDFQAQNDIDWFFLDGTNKRCHVASGGGRIPEVISNNDSFNTSFIVLARTFPELYGAEVNPQINELITFESENFRDLYLEDFIYMAKRGFYCFDNSILTDFENMKYHLVTKPKINTIGMPLLNLGEIGSPVFTSKRIDPNLYVSFNILDLF